MNTEIDESLLDDYVDGCGGVEIIATLLMHFNEQAPLKIEACRTAIEENNIQSLRSHLHSLKNSFLNVGALEMGNLVQDLEIRATVNTPKQISSDLQGVSQCLSPISTTVQDYLDRKKIELSLKTIAQ